MTRRRRSARWTSVGVGLVMLAGWNISLSGAASDLCSLIGICHYESPAFSIRVVDQETGQPVSGAHAVAVWLSFGLHGGRGTLMALESVSGSDGALSFPAWGPLQGPDGGLEPGRDPLITVFRPGYRALLLYNAGPVGQPDNARVRAFYQAGQTFALTGFRGTPAEFVAELHKAAYPRARMGLSVYDPESIRRVYVSRWERVRAEAVQLPRNVPEVEHLLNSLNTSIKLFTVGGGS